MQTLFVTDNSSGEVQRFRFPNGAYIGPLPQPPETFYSLNGACVDATNPQHVFIVNSGEYTIDEYDHNGNYVMHLSDTLSNGGLTSCAYSSTGPASGLLAVGSYANANNAGTVSIFTNNNGSWSGPVIYSESAGSYVVFMTYLGTTLYLSTEESGAFKFAKMTPTGTFTPIPLFGPSCPCTVNFPGGVQQVGRYIAVGDQLASSGAPNIYRVLPTGKVVGGLMLSPSPTDLAQFDVEGALVVAPDGDSANANIYSYQNGTFMTSVTNALVAPIAGVVSHQ